MNGHPLIAFLRARLDEDEQVARAAGNRRWLVQDNIIELYPEREDDGFMCWPTRADARHAANWEPARVLADIAAKREQADLCEYMLGWTADHNSQVTEHEIGTVRTAASEMLRRLALPYAEHRDYQEEWRP